MLEQVTGVFSVRVVAACGAMVLAVLLAPPINAHPPPRAGARDAGVDEMEEFRAVFQSWPLAEAALVGELLTTRLVCRGRLPDQRPRDRHRRFKVYRFRVPGSPEQRVAEFVCAKLSTGGALLAAGDTYYAYANQYELAQLVNSFDTLAGRSPVLLRLCVGSAVGKAAPRPGDVRDYAGYFVFARMEAADDAFEFLCEHVAQRDGFVEYQGYRSGAVQLDIYPDSKTDIGAPCDLLRGWRDGGIRSCSCDWSSQLPGHNTSTDWSPPPDEPDGGEDD